MLKQLINYWRDFVKSYLTVASFRWLVIGVLVGCFSGLVAAGFFWLVEVGKFIIQHNLAGIVSPSLRAKAYFTARLVNSGPGSSPYSPPAPAY